MDGSDARPRIMWYADIYLPNADLAQDDHDNYTLGRLVGIDSRGNRHSNISEHANFISEHQCNGDQDYQIWLFVLGAVDKQPGKATPIVDTTQINVM